jgi:hypothetical protein
MFAPSVTAAPLKPADISGYRNDLVYDRRFMYVPLNCGALPDSMPALFDLLREEADPAVRAVLGHLIFVYIHPYMEESSSLADYFCHNYSSLCAFP